MHIIVCVDDRNGMLFNFRRQSRDRLLIADVISELGDKKIYISSFSKLLFEDFEGKYIVNDSIPNGLMTDDVCFVENVDVLPYINDINKLTVYHWNRAYPGDTFFNVDLVKEGFDLSSTYEFEGYSHEKITREIFER